MERANLLRLSLRITRIARQTIGPSGHKTWASLTHAMGGGACAGLAAGRDSFVSRRCACAESNILDFDSERQFVPSELDLLSGGYVNRNPCLTAACTIRRRRSRTPSRSRRPAYTCSISAFCRIFPVSTEWQAQQLHIRPDRAKGAVQFSGRR